MYPAPIDEYVRPVTVADARATLGRYDEGDAVFVAAIQELLTEAPFDPNCGSCIHGPPMMRYAFACCKQIVIQSVP